MSASTQTEPALRIRQARDEDAPAIAALWAERLGAESLPACLERARATVRASPVHTLNLVAVEPASEAVIGWARCARFAPAPDAPPETVPAGWYMLGVNVATPWRRRGVARQLSAARARWLHLRGAEAALSFVEPTNLASLQMHRSFGFEVVDRGRRFPGLAERFLLLRRALEDG